MASRLSAQAFKVFAGGIAIGATAPVALAQEKKKPSIYDNDSESEAIVAYPGTSEPAHEHQPTESESDKKNTGLKTEIVNGVRVRSSEYLEENVNVARKWLVKQTDCAKDKLDNYFERYLNAERSVTSTVAGLKSEKEDVLPGGIYVLISTLSGSIVSRNRNIMVRALAPVVFGVGAFAYFMPQTFRNTQALAWKYEQRYPELAQAHVNTQQQLQDWAKDVNQAVDSADKSLESSVRSARHFVQDTTGLQLSSNDKKK